MEKKENNVKQLIASLEKIRNEIRKTDDFIKLLWELMHEEHIINIY